MLVRWYMILHGGHEFTVAGGFPSCTVVVGESVYGYGDILLFFGLQTFGI